MSGVNVAISRDLLHQLFWERRYGDDLVDIHQTELAEQLAVTKPTVSRVVKAMCDEGRLEQLDAARTYRVFDPDLISAE